MYLPTALIVMVSWISFLIPMENAGPRTALNITTVLTTTTMFMAIDRSVCEPTLIQLLNKLLKIKFLPL